MQMKALGGHRKTSLEALSSEVLSSRASTSAKLSSFQQFVTEMIEKDEAGGLEFNQELYDAIWEIHKFIDLLYLSASSAHKQDLDLLDKCKNISDACVHQTFSEDEKAEAQRLGDEYSTANQKHNQCRDDRQAQCQAQKDGCQNYHNYRKNVNENRGYDQFIPDCASTDFQFGFSSPERDIEKGYIDADELVPAGQNALAKMEACLDKMYDDWLYIPPLEYPPEDGLWRMYEVCKENECENLKEECNTNQKDYEDKTCYWAEYKAIHCTNYHRCMQCDNTSCAQNCEDAEDRGIGRGADNETAERLTCLLNVLFGEPNQTYPIEAPLWGYSARANDTERPKLLTGCKEGTYDTTSWNIKCDIHIVDPMDNCHSLPAQPCSPDFKAEYANLFKLSSSDTCVDADNENQGIQRCIAGCQECVIPAVIDPNPEGCD